jgi:uncharacterized membrane protein YdjX (TVP38/TMEM64 family)
MIATVQAWQGFGGFCVLTLLFTLGAVFYAPRFALYLVGGAMFGLVAIPAALLGTTIGAAVAFQLGRTVLRQRLRWQIEKRPALQKIFSAIDAESWRLVALTRLASPLPGGAINYLFGITRIAFWRYTVATGIGLLLPVTCFVVLGTYGRLAVESFEGDPAEQLAIATGAAVLLVALGLVLRRMSAGRRLSSPGGLATMVASEPNSATSRQGPSTGVCRQT